MMSEFEGALSASEDAPIDEGRETAPVSGSCPVKDVWQMDSMFKCPIIGSCLGTMEQKKLLKKASIKYDDKNEFEIHEIFVALSDTENELSKKLNRFLRGKYLPEVRHLMSLSEDAFIDEWMELFDDGRLGAAVYAIAARHGVSSTLKKQAFGMIHMNMHDSTHKKTALRNALNQARQRIQSHECKSKALISVTRELKKDNKSLARAVEEARVEQARLRVRCESCLAELDELKRAMAVAPAAAGPDAEAPSGGPSPEEHMILLSERDRYKHRVEELEKDLEKERQSHGITRCRLDFLLRNSEPPEECDTSCPSYDLCRKRILIVGGMTKMSGHYRKIVEAKGGLFEYHNGNMKNGTRGLESLFKRADIVICPVDCNSHAACNAVKRLGKKHNKTVRILFGSSLNAINQALTPDQQEMQGMEL